LSSATFSVFAFPMSIGDWLLPEAQVAKSGLSDPQLAGPCSVP
jgi:hypothetical protein